MKNQLKILRAMRDWSQAELGEQLDVSRQAVNQQLQAWKAKGWVDLARGSVTVRDEQALENAARGK